MNYEHHPWGSAPQSFWDDVITYKREKYENFILDLKSCIREKIEKDGVDAVDDIIDILKEKKLI